MAKAISEQADQAIQYYRAVSRIFRQRRQTPHIFTGDLRIQTGFLVGRFVFTPTQMAALGNRSH